MPDINQDGTIPTVYKARGDWWDVTECEADGVGADNSSCLCCFDFLLFCWSPLIGRRDGSTPQLKSGYT